MGNVVGSPALSRISPDNAGRVFATLDQKNQGYLSLKELMSATSPGIIMPHSLPALFFVDAEKDGRITLSQFTELVRLCQLEKEKAQDSVCKDKAFRDVITRASAAGVKDSSIPSRTSFRRFYSYSNVQTLFNRRGSTADLSPPSQDTASSNPHPHPHPHPHPSAFSSCASSACASRPPRFPCGPCTSSSAAELAPGVEPTEADALGEDVPTSYIPVPNSARVFDPASSSSDSDSASESCDPVSYVQAPEMADCTGRNYSGGETTANWQGDECIIESRGNGDVRDTCGVSERGDHSNSNSDSEDDTSCDSSSDSDSESDSDADSSPSRRASRTSPDASATRLEPLDAQRSTAIEAAVMESVSRTHIHKLADVLHEDISREYFMQWLWNLVDFNCNGIITLEELRVFLQALKEDGIDLEELAFYKESGVPLDECIINEFDTTHSGGLEQDEFMVLADLVTREYEHWEGRHLDCIGDYELGRTIGRGSSCVVRLGVHVETHEKFAVKIIRKGKCADMSSVDREINALQSCKHRYVVDLEEVLDSGENMFLILGLCGGGSLSNVVRLYPDERMPERTARLYVRQIFEALAFCHESGYCHRDVRLDNVLLDNAGVVKLTDFGHSKQFSAGWDLHSSTLVGSVFNLSPEQVAGQLYSGEKIDVWSMGVAVYTLLVGRPPFHDVDTVRLLHDISTGTFTTPDFISDEAADLIRCMVRVSPDERLSISQLLRHPWFYVGEEHVPKMDVYIIAVDSVFQRRPDLAEMIIAGTIHEHNLHFHLADTLSPNSSPDDLRGQDWSLKCLCPQLDIKFAVSLFSMQPGTKRRDLPESPPKPPGLSCAASYSVLAVAAKPAGSILPQAHRKDYGELYDMFENDADDTASDSAFEKVCARRRHKRSKSLDGTSSDEHDLYDHANDPSQFDAFPNRVILPRKKMPEETRLFDSDRRIAAAAAAAVKKAPSAYGSFGVSSLHKSFTMEGVSSARRARVAEEVISKSIAQHPSKAHTAGSSDVEPKRGVVRESSTDAGSPYIEVRLQCGESGLFLRICQKLKTICDTKLATAAESQKQRSVSRRTASASISAFRRTAAGSTSISQSA